MQLQVITCNNFLFKKNTMMNMLHYNMTNLSNYDTFV